MLREKQSAKLLGWALASLASSILLAGLLAGQMLPSHLQQSHRLAPWFQEAAVTRGVATMGTPLDALAVAGRESDSDRGITALLDQHLAGAGPGAVVVGMVSDGKVSVVGRGDPDRPDGGPADGRTLFQIASLTKPLTGSLMARMMVRGDITADDPLYRHLDLIPPAAGRPPVRLIDLATHTGGLPSVPETGQFSWSRLADPRNPYKPLSRSEVRHWIAGYQPAVPRGTRFVYSNVGMALLGEALARVAGVDYAALLEREITAPLGMTDTVLTLNAGQKGRKATGHAAGQPVPDWEAPAMQPSFGVYSTVDDMLRWLRANLGNCGERPCSPELTQALTLAQVPLRQGRALFDPGALGDGAMALGWFVAPAGDGTSILWHSGSTGGFNSYIALSPSHGWAVVALAGTDPKKVVADQVVKDLVGMLRARSERPAS